MWYSKLGRSMNQSWLTLLVLVQGNYSYFCGSHLWGNSVMFSAFAHFHGLYSPRNSLGVGSLSLLQGIFPTQELNPGLPHCRRIIYQLSHKGSPRILEWVAYPFFFLTQDLPDTGIELGSPALQAESLPTELWGKPIYIYIYIQL